MSQTASKAWLSMSHFRRVSLQSLQLGPYLKVSEKECGIVSARLAGSGLEGIGKAWSVASLSSVSRVFVNDGGEPFFSVSRVREPFETV